MNTIVIYVLPNRTSGGFSVVENLYHDLVENITNYPDTKWIFVVGKRGLETKENISVVFKSWPNKSLLHRYVYETLVLKKMVKEINANLVFSINMIPAGVNKNSVVSLHNVLPLYTIDRTVFDSCKSIIKQRMINTRIIRSLKRTDAIIVPSQWIKRELHNRFNIDEDKIFVSQITTLEMSNCVDLLAGQSSIVQKHIFIFPATGFPYKNHRTIVDACKLLKNDGIRNYEVRFIGDVGNGRNIKKIKEEVSKDELPIIFTGLIKRHELASYYKDCTLIFPSSIETDAFPILECMECGGYILSVDLPYAREALNEYSNKSLFKERDSKELYALMKKRIDGELKTEIVSKSAIRKSNGTPRTDIIMDILKRRDNTN